jgi:hypothetical protein
VQPPTAQGEGRAPRWRTTVDRNPGAEATTQADAELPGERENETGTDPTDRSSEQDPAAGRYNVAKLPPSDVAGFESVQHCRQFAMPGQGIVR